MIPLLHAPTRCLFACRQQPGGNRKVASRTRMRADIEVEGAEYRGKRSNRAAVFGEQEEDGFEPHSEELDWSGGGDDESEEGEEEEEQEEGEEEDGSAPEDEGFDGKRGSAMRTVGG